MSAVQFLTPPGGDKCVPAIAPVGGQWAVPFDAAGADTGATPVTPVGQAADDPAFYGGSLTLLGCYDAKVTVEYLTGDDCDPCTTPDMLDIATFEFVVGANTVAALPDGWWQSVTIGLIDVDGAPVDLAGTATEKATLSSFTAGSCCQVLAIDGGTAATGEYATGGFA